MESAQDRWRAELVDLGGRNSLMWHRELPTGTIDLTVAHPGGVAKLLAGHNTLLSELVRESVALAEARRRVSAIRAKGVELQREYGMSTLFLAVGMASWQLPRAPIPPRAPVLLRGARIRPTDASRRDFVLRLDSDVVLNPALEHYLRAERGLELDGHELARASNGRHGFDPRPTYDRLEAICAGVPEFGIGPQLVLSTYPLAKLPLIAELSGSADALTRHPLLVAMAASYPDAEEAHAPGEPSPPAGEVDAAEEQPPPAGEVDAAQEESTPAGEADGAEEQSPPAGEVDAAEELPPPAGHATTVLEADRPQRAVLDLLARGRSVVLDAEPGTGRTQTIVNAVADAVARGGSVLVAAEHRRALEDVHERLRGIGLGELVLEVRETPAAARRAGAELVDALDRHQAAASSTEPAAEGSVADDHPATAEGDPVEVLRAHEEHLHGRHEPWGVSLAETQDVLTRLAALPQPPASHVRLEPDVLAGLTREGMDEVRAALTRAVAAGAWKRRGEDPWFGAQISTEPEAERAAAIVNDLVSGRFTQAREDLVALARSAGLPAPTNLQQWTSTFDLLRRVRDTLDVFTPEVYEAPLDDLVRGTTKHPRGSGDKLPAMTRSRLRRQARALLRPGTPPPDLAERLAHARAERTEWESLAGRAARPSTPRGWEEAADEYAAIHRDLEWLAGALAGTAHGRDLETTHLDLLLERLVRLDAHTDRLPVVAAVHADLQPLRDRGLGRLVDDLARRGVQAEHVEAEADLVFWASVHDRLTAEASHATSAELRKALVDLDTRERARADTARRRVLAAARERVDAVLVEHPEQADALRSIVDAGPPLLLLDLISAAPDLVRALRPCWLASPLTVPATIPSDTELDLVVLDESHRIPLAHAVPSLARAASVLVVGDSGGLPGLPFVGVVDEQQAERDQRGETVHAAAVRVLPVRSLDTHYRALDQRMVPRRRGSRVEGFPGVLRQSRIAVVEVPEREELVGRVVDTVLDHARRSPRHSLGVLVDDVEVVAQIEEELWARVAQEADLIGSFREDVAEPFLVGTVERAAGDVRDRVVLVLTGRTDLSEAWAATALSTARRSVVVLLDRPPAELTGSPGADLLRETMTRAAADPEAPGDQSPADPAGAALVADLAARLRAEHLTVRPGFGRGPHRIELAVDDPDDPGRPLLAIDSDARPEAGGLDPDRLRTRSLHLQRLGWTPVQVWTTDVFRDPAREVARIVDVARRASANRRR